MYPAPPPHPPRPYQRPRQTNPALIVLAVVAGIILLCCGGGCVRAVLGTSDDGPSTAETTTTARVTTPRAAPPPITTSLPAPVGGLSEQDINDMAFMMSMDSEDIPYSSREAIIELGHAVCDGLASGSDETAIALVIADKGYSPSNAGYIVGAAQSSYCPQYR